LVNRRAVAGNKKKAETILLNMDDLKKGNPYPDDFFDTPTALQDHIDKEVAKHKGYVPYGFNPFSPIIFVKQERLKTSFDEFKQRLKAYVIFTQTIYFNNEIQLSIESDLGGSI